MNLIKTEQRIDAEPEVKQIIFLRERDKFQRAAATCLEKRDIAVKI